MAALTNTQIAARLGQLAELLRDQGVNRFKVKAYRNAADALRNYPERISDLLAQGRPLPKIKGVGQSIASAIEEIVGSGTLKSIGSLEKDLPTGTAAIAEAARISVRDAQRIAKALNVSTPEDLKARLDAGEVGPAVGARLEFKLRRGLADVRRLLWVDAKELSDHYHALLADITGVTRIEPAGSLRRGKDTVGTLRFVVHASGPARVRKAVREQAWVESVQEETDARITCKLAAGPLLVVRLAEEPRWGDALIEETGSYAHLEEVRRLAPSSRRAAPTEQQWYKARRLAWIPPELREGRGEVQAALDGALPTLVELTQIVGDLHAHTTASDGASTLEEMAGAAKVRGYQYLAITDHSKNLKITNGLDEKRLAAQGAEIDRLNARLKGLRLLKGSEVDILEDGSLDFADPVLRKLEVVIGSIHSRFGLDKDAQTRRLLRAIANPCLTCVGHMTGRKLLSRPGYELDTDEILKAVKRHGKLLEINASPDRLDIDDQLAKQALDMGIPLLVNTDAHSTRELDFMMFGIRQARRGWRTPESIVNTRPLPQLLKLLASTRKAAPRRTRSAV